MAYGSCTPTALQRTQRRKSSILYGFFLQPSAEVDPKSPIPASEWLFEDLRVKHRKERS